MRACAAALRERPTLPRLKREWAELLEIGAIATNQLEHVLVLQADAARDDLGRSARLAIVLFRSRPPFWGSAVSTITTAVS